MSNNSEKLVLDELQWKSPEWIQYFQGLNSNNVLEYFMESPFYSESNKAEISNNQLVKMQSLEGVDNSNVNEEDIMNNNGTTPDVDRSEILKNLPYHIELHKTLVKFKQGVEFILLAVNEPNNWIIRQQRKETVVNANQQTTVIYTVINEYYIIGSNVYMAPRLGDIINSGLLNCSYFLNESLNKIKDMTNGFTIKKGFGFNKETLQEHQYRVKRTKKVDLANKDKESTQGKIKNEDMALVDKMLAQ